MDRSLVSKLPGVLSTMERGQVTLVDEAGNSVSLEVLIADQAHERLLGFQGVPKELAQDMAILFVWDEAGNYGFWNRGVTINLDVLFFAEDGSFAGDLTMPAGSKDRYAARNPFMYALEVPEGRLRELGLGKPVRLLLP